MPAKHIDNLHKNGSQLLNGSRDVISLITKVTKCLGHNKLIGLVARKLRILSYLLAMSAQPH